MKDVIELDIMWMKTCVTYVSKHRKFIGKIQIVIKQLKHYITQTSKHKNICKQL